MTRKKDGKELVGSVLNIAAPSVFRHKALRNMTSGLLAPLLRWKKVPINEAGKAFNTMAKDPSLANATILRDSMYGMIHVENKEIIPQDTGCIVIVDHPTGLMDGIMLSGTLNEIAGKDRIVKLLARGELKGIDWIFPVKVNKSKGGKIDKGATITEAKDILIDQKGIVALFPSGMIATIDSDTGKLTEQQFKRSFWKAAVHLGVPIVTAQLDAQGPRKHYEQLQTAEQRRLKRKRMMGLGGRIHRTKGMLGLALSTDSYTGATFKFTNLVTPEQQQRLKTQFPGDEGDAHICELFRQYCSGENQDLEHLLEPGNANIAINK